MPLTDEELAIKALQDDTAMDELFTRYKSVVRRISRSFFLDGGDSDDLLQEGMIGLIKAVRGYNDDKNTLFKSFATMCIKSSLIDAVKASTRNKHKALSGYISIYADENDESPVPQILIDYTDPEKTLLDKERNEEIKQDLSKELSTIELTILTSYLKGDSYADISKSIGKPSKYVDNKLQSIKRRLKNTLQKYL